MENRPEKQRTEKTGIVISDRMHKTRLVQVTRIRTHPLYQKKIRSRKKFMVHDENNVSKVGDLVRIIHTRPLSKRKRWRLAEILKEAEEGAGSGQESSNGSVEVAADRGR